MDKKIKLELTEEEFKYLSGLVLHPFIYGGIGYAQGADLSLMKKTHDEFKRLGYKCSYNSYWDSYYKDKIDGE